MAGCTPVGPTVSLEGCSGGEQGCRSVASTVTYPEANVSASILCSNPGANGWCIGSASLEINSSEPVPGFNILTVEGTRNGATFACSGSTCSVPLLEGANNFTFWALSSWGDSSGMGSASGSVDTQPPFINGSLSGVAGNGGWFVSPVEVSATASDATSGVGMIVYSLDGGAQTGYSGPFSVGDGTHSIVFTATDVAGNSSSQTVNVNVDLGLPVLAIDPASGTPGSGGWFLSSATVNASATDGGSGLASLEYSIDGGASTVYTGPVTLGDGTHTVVFTATDQAGNSVSGSSTVNVDTQAPQLALAGAASYCSACGGTMAINYSVGDGASGVTVWTLMVDGSTLVNGTAAEVGTYDWDGSGLPAGAHTITLVARDLAGNLTQTEMPVTLTVPPSAEEPTSPPAARRATATRTGSAPKSTSTSTGAGGSGSGSTATGMGGRQSTPTKTNAVIAFSQPTQGTRIQNAPSNSPNASTPSGVLFGVEAAAAIGGVMALVAAARQRREEEDARAATESARFNSAQIAIEEQRRREAAQRAWDKKQKEEAESAEAAANAAFTAKLSEAQGWGLPPRQINDYIEMAKNSGYAAAIAALDAFIAKAMQDAANTKAFQDYMKQKEAEEKARKEAEEKAKKEAEEKAKQEAEAAAAAAAAAAEAEKNKPWWEKAIDSVKDAADKAIKFVDDHQEGFAIGIGVLAGAIGIGAILLTGGLAAPLLIAGVAALSAGAIVGAGTVGLNAYYGRPPGQNLIRNVGMAATTAFVISIAPSFIVAGQTIVAAAVPSVGALLGASGMVATALSTAAPYIGFGASMLVLGSMASGGIGMAMADDPTISEEERQMGRNLEVLGLAGLTLGTGIFDTAEAVNSAFPEGSQELPTKDALVNELNENGINNTPEDIVGIEYDSNGRIIFLEKGNSTAGLTHIIEEHGDDFANVGITTDQIPDLIMKAATQGRIVGMQGGRPIYEVIYNGVLQRMAITISDNGFIVGANPAP